MDLLAAALPQDGLKEVLPGLMLARASQPTGRLPGAFRPALCVIAQGSKDLYVGDRVYRYDADNYLIANLELPVAGQIVQASQAHPYLSLRLDLEPSLVSAVMVEAGLPSPSTDRGAKAIAVSNLEPELLDAIVRLVRLLSSPAETRVLLPVVKREIIFRLIQGDQSGRLRHLPMLGANMNRIAQAVHRLRQEFDQPLSVGALAKDLGMSPSGFHHHFRSVTDMSPLQFQKLLRLQEARRLMLSGDCDASSAGYRVGYIDPSHFSRDFKKHFGEAPMRHVEKLRQRVGAD